MLTSVTFRSDGTGFASCYRPDGTEGIILISEDDGLTWYGQFSTSGFNHSRRIYDLYFFDDEHGYASTHIRPLRTNGLVTGMEAVEGTRLQVFPNPAAEVINLEGSGSGAFIEVLDATGRVLLSRVTSGEQERMDISGLAPGSYVVRLTRGERRMSATFMRM